MPLRSFKLGLPQQLQQPPLSDPHHLLQLSVIPESGEEHLRHASATGYGNSLGDALKEMQGGSSKRGIAKEKAQKQSCWVEMCAPKRNKR